VLNLAAEVIVLSSYWEQVLCTETDLDEAMVLPNPIDVSSFSEDGCADDTHIVYVSNLIERKGVAEFVEAIRRLHARDGPEFRVSIAGDGPEAEQMQALAADYEFVEYYGYVSESRKYELLTDGSIYVLPTYAEGLPIALLEGMAGGNAVVSTEVGAIPEVVGAENGIVIPPVDVDALVDALETLRTDGQLRRSMGETNRALVREQYTWSRISRELQELYERLRARSQPGASRTGGSPSATATSPE
jgi:glycosyltransferase involved in cell wall biosynthesis